MTFTATFIMMMKEMGSEPFGCLVKGCEHVSRSTFGMIVHDRFGVHGADHGED